MQNMFSTTQQPSSITITQLETIQQVTQINNTSPQGQTQGQGQGTEFNTLQNLFQTGASVPIGNIGQLGQNTQAQDVLGNVNIQDFNTMQNLFKTGSVPTMPAPQQIQQPQTQNQDPFTLLSSSQPQNISPVHFNTYSGVKSSAPEIDLNAFGTMQKGNSAGFDFGVNANNTNTQNGQPQTANFSKKKAPA